MIGGTGITFFNTFAIGIRGGTGIALVL